MRKTWFHYLLATTLFCLSAAAIKSEIPFKAAPSWAVSASGKKDTTRCKKMSAAPQQKKCPAPVVREKPPVKTPQPVSSVSDFGHDAFFIKI